MKHLSVLLPGRCFSLLLCMMLILSAASLVNAQSGRKISKRPPAPATQTTTPSEPPIPPPTAPSTTPSTAPNTKPAIPVLVTRYLPNFNSSNIYTDIVIDGFMARMASAKGVSVQVGKEVNRKQASDAAKASADGYVVWIQLQVDMVDAERAGIGANNPAYLYVDYVVFTPGTGKQKSSGHVYQRPNALGNGPLPLPRTNSAAEYMLRKAGEETAGRVLDALDLNAPPVIRH
jgi:hypothetical protein